MYTNSVPDIPSVPGVPRVPGVPSIPGVPMFLAFPVFHSAECLYHKQTKQAVCLHNYSAAELFSIPSARACEVNFYFNDLVLLSFHCWHPRCQEEWVVTKYCL